MKYFNKIILIFFCLLIFSGCSIFTPFITQMGEDYQEALKVSKSAGKILIKDWPYWSGYLKGAMGDNWLKLPFEAIMAWKELDCLAGIEDQFPGYFNSNLRVSVWALSDCEMISGLPDDYKMGYAQGLVGVLFSKIVLQMLKGLAPDFFSLITI